MTQDILDLFSSNWSETKQETMTISEYLDLCCRDQMAYATPAERMVKAIGEPIKVDTANDSRLGRIFLNRTIKIYPAFKDFYGMEDTIERIVGYFVHAAQGLEERKQILYLLGPVGGGKSSLAERLKELMETYPIYALATDNEISPVFESPLGLFNNRRYHELLYSQYGIEQRYLNMIPSPWAIKRLKQFNGDLTKFSVVKLMPSKLEQIAVVKTEPGDENNQDISSLVGKTDIRMLEKFSQNDPDAYSFSGALCRGNQGIMEFVEMFKAPIKVLHPLLTATQEGNYIGTEAISAIPFNGVVLAHCFSDDTELLTSGGWKSREMIEVGDSVATFNKQTGMIEYQPAINKIEQYYDGDMYHMHSSAADHLVTPNHKMIYESYGSYKEVLAQDFFIKGAQIPVAGKVQRDDIEYYKNDEELRFHVWCITDGSVYYINKNGQLTYRFHLKKERKISALGELLSKLDFEWTSSVQTTGNTVITVKNVHPKFSKQLQEIHRNLSPRQVTILLETWGITDGTQSDLNRDNHYQLSTNNPFHRDLIQELAAISGHKTTCAISKKPGHDDVFMLNIRMNTSNVRSDFVNKGTVEYQGMVWCLETANHTLVARRNGKVIITGNSNESEWQSFKTNRNNEAFLDRICVIKVPYCLRVTEEQAIYEKMIESSDLKNSPCAPETFKLLSRFCVLTRLRTHENSNLYSKLRVYDGENIKETDPRAKSLQEYKDVAGQDEGMSGISTRFAFKILSSTFNHDPEEVAADPVHLMLVLENAIRREQFSQETEEKYLGFIKDNLITEYAEYIGNEIQQNYLESYTDYGQNLFDRYLMWADHWMQEIDYKDPDTGQLFDRELLNSELEKIEKPAGIANPKDFRNEVVGFVLRQSSRSGKPVSWTSYEKLRKVIEKKMFSSTEDLLPVISFGAKSNKEDQKKHDDFVNRMVKKGYSPRQVRRAVDWYMRVSKAG